MNDAIRYTAALPHGYEASFSWSDGAMQVEWSPAVPHIESARHRRKFLTAYQLARSAFLRDVATTLGSSVLIADLTGEFEIVEPGTRH